MHLYIAVPTYAGGLSAQTHRSLMAAAVGAPEAGHTFHMREGSKSLLANNFNTFWAEALNLREAGTPIDWFVLLHADLGSPDPAWLWKLIEAADEHGLDAISAVAAIKDASGHTSTALWKDGQIHRLSMPELRAMPRVVTDAWIRRTQDATLLINTGMLALRMGREWNEEHCWTIDDVLQRGPDGKWQAVVLSEDWRMSLWMAERGIPYGVHRGVPTVHSGGADFKCDGRENGIPGWMECDDLEWLAERAAQSDSVVEVGCYKGRTTAELVRACAGTVYAVDHWQGTPGQANVPGGDAIYEEFLRHVNSVRAGADRRAFRSTGRAFRSTVGAGAYRGPAVHVVRHDSVTAAAQIAGDGPFDMVFLDGDHSYEAVAADIAAWGPLCSGLLCGHDIDEPDVLRAVSEAFGGRWVRVSPKLWAVDLAGIVERSALRFGE